MCGSYQVSDRGRHTCVPAKGGEKKAKQFCEWRKTIKAIFFFIYEFTQLFTWTLKKNAVSLSSHWLRPQPPPHAPCAEVRLRLPSTPRTATALCWNFVESLGDLSNCLPAISAPPVRKLLGPFWVKNETRCTAACLMTLDWLLGPQTRPQGGGRAERSGRLSTSPPQTATATTRSQNLTTFIFYRARGKGELIEEERGRRIISPNVSLV
jgi:hypothetical protein